VVEGFAEVGGFEDGGHGFGSGCGEVNHGGTEDTERERDKPEEISKTDMCIVI
jgi:hypothetical protein